MQNPISYVEVKIIDLVRKAFLGCSVLYFIKFHETFDLGLPALQCKQRQKSETRARVGAQPIYIKR
jgi:hypothetical protein